MNEQRIFVSQLQRGDLIRISSDRHQDLPDPPYRQVTVRSIRFVGGVAVVRTDDGEQRRFPASNLITVYKK